MRINLNNCVAGAAALAPGAIFGAAILAMLGFPSWSQVLLASLSLVAIAVVGAVLVSGRIQRAIETRRLDREKDMMRNFLPGLDDARRFLDGLCISVDEKAPMEVAAGKLAALGISTRGIGPLAPALRRALPRTDDGTLLLIDGCVSQLRNAVLVVNLRGFGEDAAANDEDVRRLRAAVDECRQINAYIERNMTFRGV
jgi:hypothetical protein